MGDDQLTFDDLHRRGPGILARFEAFIRANPRVWELFERFALQAAGQRPRYSARTIIERVRWEVDVETQDLDGLGLKINDHFSPYLGRLFVAKYPQHAGLFERRILKSAHRGGAPTIDRTPHPPDPVLDGRMRGLLKELEKPDAPA